MDLQQRFLVLCLAATLNGCNHDTRPVAQKEQAPAVIKLDTLAVLAKADSLLSVGEHYLATNKKDSALYFHEQALNAREKTHLENIELVKSYNKVAELYLEQVKYVVADKYLENARLISDRVSIPPALLVDIYLESANCKMNLLDIAFSNSLLHKALTLVEENFPKNRTLLCKVYFELAANYYYDKQYAKSIDFLKQALLVVPPGDYERLGNIYLVFGIIDMEKKEPKKALVSYNKSIRYNQKWTGTDTDPLAIVYLQKAFALIASDQKDSARYYFIKNLNIRRKVFGDKHVNTFGAKWSLAQFNYRIGAYDSAARYFHESLISLILNFKNHNLFSNPKPSPTEMNRDIILGLVGKAKALKKLGEMDSTNIDRRVLSLKTFELADSIFKIFRNNNLYDDPQLRQLASGEIPYDEMEDITFQLYALTREPKYFGMALNIMEHSRAVLLQNSLQIAEAYSSAGIDFSFKQRENNLAKYHAEILRSLSKPDLPKAFADSLNDSLLSNNNALLKLRNEIGAKNPNYFGLKYNTSSVNVAELRQLLKAQNSILLEYLWSDSAIYAIIVNEDTTITKVIRQTTALKNAFRVFVGELNTSGEAGYQPEHFQKFSKSAHALYLSLVADLLRGTEIVHNNTNLIISADGQLASFPFEALITQLPETNDVDYRLRYLILDQPISYSYSSGILLRQHKNKREGNKVLAFGFAGNGLSTLKRDNNSNLPGTEVELNAIKAIMNNKDNKFFFGEEATESNFKKQAVDFDIVHLAVHGVADTVNAMESRLIFRNDADSAEDGNLYAHELYDLNLSKIDLTVLSACESGIGKSQTGEGVMSIARGFAYAGCPSLVISLWKIDDRTSAKVISRLYHYLAIRQPINIALAHAKMDYIKNAGEFNSHPFYWAAFLQIGDTRELDNKVRISWMLALWIVIICSVAGFLFLFYRKKHITKS